MDTKKIYNTLINRVRNESTLEGLRQLESESDNLYEMGCLRGFQFRQIDLLIMERMITMEVKYD